MDDRPSKSGKQDDLDPVPTELPDEPAADNEELLELGEEFVVSADEPAVNDEDLTVTVEEEEEIILLEPAEELPFEQLGRYRVINRMGRGRLGDVYQGRDESAGAPVVIKVLAPELAEDEDCLARFQTAAEAATGLFHDNIVPVFFAGEDAGRHFLVMQDVQGRSLAQRLPSREGVPVSDVFTVVQQCLAGLLCAHAEGVIHGDISPRNILLLARTNRVMLTDFGLAAVIGLNASEDDTKTLAYRSPEQVQGQPADVQSDIYSLGAVTYRMLAGYPPFAGGNSSDVARRIVSEEPYPLARELPDLPSAAVDIVQGMMAQRPAERYRNCTAVLSDIQAYRMGRPIDGPIAPRDTSDPTPAPPPPAEEPTGDTEDPQPPADADVEIYEDVAVVADTEVDADVEPEECFDIDVNVRPVTKVGVGKEVCEKKPAGRRRFLAAVAFGAAVGVLLVLDPLHWFGPTPRGNPSASVPGEEAPASPVVPERPPAGTGPRESTSPTLAPPENNLPERSLLEPSSTGHSATPQLPVVWDRGTETAQGTVHDDQNGNGQRDPGEPPLAGCTVVWQRLDSQSGPVRTFTDPHPVLRDRFGASVSGSGDRVLIGAPTRNTTKHESGAAYLFDRDTGKLLHTFDNPEPGNGDGFGNSVAWMGDTVAIGASSDDTGERNAGSAYIFDAKIWDLLHSIPNPTPSYDDRFASAMAAADGELLIGCHKDDIGAENSGAAYLIDCTSGKEIHAFANPAPKTFDWFGNSVAGGGGRIAVGVHYDDTVYHDTGLVYVFDTHTKALLHTIASPTPQSYTGFGDGLAIDAQYLLIGEPALDGKADRGGKAYVFDPATGEFRFMLDSPEPDTGDQFGRTVAILGDLLIVACPARDRTYVFDGITGDWLQTLTIPVARNSGGFGFALAAVDEEYLLVGSPVNNNRGHGVGAVHLHRFARRTVVADDQGNYVLEGLSPGKYRVAVESTGDGSRPDFPASVRVITLKADQQPEPVDLVGKAKAGTGPRRYVKALIDEVAVFTRALSEEEMDTLYQMGIDGVPLGGEPVARPSEDVPR